MQKATDCSTNKDKIDIGQNRNTLRVAHKQRLFLQIRAFVCIAL